MTSVQSMEMPTPNTTSGSYEVPGNGNVSDAYIIGDTVEVSRFPANTLEQGVTITEPSDNN